MSQGAMVDKSLSKPAAGVSPGSPWIAVLHSAPADVKLTSFAP